MTPFLVCLGIVASNKRFVAGVTFADNPRLLFVSARVAADSLSLPLTYDPNSDLAFLGSIPIDYESAVGKEHFVSVASLKSLGAKVVQHGGYLAVDLNGKEMDVRSGSKSALIDKSSQTMKIFQGGSLVLTTRVSTGKYSRWTPDGTFRVGDLKDAYHSSSKYDDAPMPWAVHVVGSIYIHGGVVPDYPASHGCIRLPDDAAQWFYRWATPGTLVKIRE